MKKCDEVMRLGLDSSTPPIKTAVIFIGIPASGKSSYFAEHYKGKYAHINLDTLNTRKKEAALLRECLIVGKSFVVDNTNPTKTDRKRYIIPAKSNGFRVEGYFFQSVLVDCVTRNEKRTGKSRIPNIAIASISNKLELPCIEEGFDELYFVKLSDGGFITEEWRDER